MPNWVSVNIKFDTNLNTANEIIESLKNEEGAIDFNVLLPMPEALSNVQVPVKLLTPKDYNAQDFTNGNTIGITKGMQNAFISLYGSDNWYDWSTKNWGTKWNIDETIIDGDTIRFLAANSAPLLYIEAISAKFPNIKIQFSWANEDTGRDLGYGELLAGETILFEEPEDTETDNFCAGAALQIQDGAIRWNDEICEALGEKHYADMYEDGL